MSHATITLDTTIGRTDAVLASGLGDETVMMDMEQGHYYGLNATGSQIWNLLAQPMVVRDLCAQLAAQYEVSPQQCEDEIVAFLGDLLERKVIRIVAASDL